MNRYRSNAPMTERGLCAVTGPTGETCPYCGARDGTRQTSEIGRTRAWACERCGTEWAVSLVRPDSRAAGQLSELGAAAQEIRWLRATLHQLIALADEATRLSDHQLRARLLALAGECAR